MTQKKYRHLTEEEISLLQRQGCESDNWEDVFFSGEDDSSLSRIRNVVFSGTVRFGRFSGTFSLPGGMVKKAGMRDVSLHNVTVGEDCCIENIRGYIAGYEIGDGTLIENVDALVTEPASHFGNGVEVAVLNETGGREVIITDVLSAQTAYLMAMYRHRPVLTEKFRRMALDYAESRRSDTGRIGSGVVIRNAGMITSVNIGDNSSVIGAGRLHNGSINSNSAAPVTIGYGVVAEDFIICSGSRVEDNTTITRCFVGQSCILGHGYSASDSLFFSNCQGENGEACAIFAGPFTVTHHKSTLLIAGMFSFMNAGSGSNQINHMYKLGPIHQGILERGAKTASDSYILWPSRVGAFSLVMGRHVTHSDTTSLPFSYLIEQKNETYLVPGVNLRSVGTIRDAQKWPRRDNRTDPHKLDIINFNLLSPYTIQKMFKGIQLLKNLQYASGMLSEEYAYHSTKIRNRSLVKGIGYYEMAITKFLGNSLISRLGNRTYSSDEQLRAALAPDSPVGSGRWADVSGLIAPKTEITALMNAVEQGEIDSVNAVNAAFRKMHEHYYSYEWTWAYDHFAEFFGVDPARMTRSDAVDIIRKWQTAVIDLDRMLYEDARKEFSLASMTGFGADGSREIKEKDFGNVRGDFESNSFVRAVLNHIEVKRALGDDAISRLQ